MISSKCKTTSHDLGQQSICFEMSALNEVYCIYGHKRAIYNASSGKNEMSCNLVLNYISLLHIFLNYYI